MIVGMTTSTPQPTQIAILRKGGEKKGNTPGPDLQHFRLDPVDSKDAALVDSFNAAYDGKPNHIKVYLPFATAAENFDAWREEWTASQLKHRCDGESIWAYDGQGRLRDTGQPCPYLKLSPKDKKCKQVGRLSVILLDLVEVGRFGITTALTTSIHDIVNISRALSYYEVLAKGDLRGVPFVLSRHAVEISTPSTSENGRTRREKWLMAIEPAQEWVKPTLEASRRLRLSAPAMRQIVDQSTGEVVDDDVIDVEPSPQARPTLQDLVLFGQEWGLLEEETKQVLKDAGFKGYRWQNFEAMKEAIVAACAAVAPDVEVQS